MYFYASFVIMMGAFLYFVGMLLFVIGWLYNKDNVYLWGFLICCGL